jgi:hypothetical protein
MLEQDDLGVGNAGLAFEQLVIILRVVARQLIGLAGKLLDCRHSVPYRHDLKVDDIVLNPALHKHATIARGGSVVMQPGLHQILVGGVGLGGGHPPVPRSCDQRFLHACLIHTPSRA